MAEGAGEVGRVHVDENSKQKDLDAARVRLAGTHLTTNTGCRQGNNTDSLKAGERGPTLLEDHFFREKITQFDHERIPERVVHARGHGAHGFFEVYKSLKDITRARVLCDPSVRTPVFVRFSTVVGFRGSADTVRDVRGFAVKFYTEEGNWDLVGNALAPFYIQDAIKFPDLIHAAKPRPHNDIPQAQSAHEEFWDFISLTPESAHMIMWHLSDRAIPRSFRMIEGFGVNTFKLVNEDGRVHFVKFHWKPKLGVHSLVWDEATKLAGKDPDFLKRDLWCAIEQGCYPEWEMGLQLIAEGDEDKFDFDVLDATKIWPEEVVPVQRVGRMVLNRNTDNFFAETEQVAFHPAHLVPGIDVSDDPLLQGRLFSYLDTQINRFSSANFNEVPINRPLAPVANERQDGFMRRRINVHRVNYEPNTLGGGCPMVATWRHGGYENRPEAIPATTKVRGKGPKFSDHFSQAKLFYNSLSAVEKLHLVEAAQFELGKCDVPHVREAVVNMFANIDAELAGRVAYGLGLSAPAKALTAAKAAREVAGAVAERVVHPLRETYSPALSQVNQPMNSIEGRRVAVLVAPGFDAKSLGPFKEAVVAGRATVSLIAPTMGALSASEGAAAEADHALLTAESVMFDAVVVAGGAASVDALLSEGKTLHFVKEAFLHCKTIAAIAEGIDVLDEAGLPVALAGRAKKEPSKRRAGLLERAAAKAAEWTSNVATPEAEHRSGALTMDEGVITATRDAGMGEAAAALVRAMCRHRHWGRQLKKLDGLIDA